MPADPPSSRPGDASHGGWAVRRYRLGEEPPAAEAPALTAEARVELVATLSARFWELTGRAWPRLPRSAWPITRQRRS